MICRILLALLLAVPATRAQTGTGNAWLGLEPLHSTRDDVEKLLGKPINKDLNIYDSQNDSVTVWYSNGNCREDDRAVWNAKRDVVIGILVSPKKSRSVDLLKKQLNQSFAREADGEMHGRFFYFNTDGSIKFDSQLLPDGGEEVIFIVFAPRASENYLRCVRSARS